MTKSVLTFGLMLFYFLAATAQGFKLYYANNVTDVNDFNGIVDDDSGLNWRLVGDGDMDGNNYEVDQVRQMLASREMKGYDKQQQFWTMRDHTLLCFHIVDDTPGADSYEVKVTESDSGNSQSLTVTNYFFVNLPLMYPPSTEYVIDVTSVADTTQHKRF